MAIYKDKKRGTYYVSTYVDLKNGDRKRVLKRGFKTKKEAKKAESEIVFNAAIDNPDNPFFTDVVDEYISWYEKRRKESSLHRLKKECRLYINPFFGRKHIQDIKKRDIMKFHDFLLDRLSITTSKNVHGYLSAIFNYSIKMEYVNLNIAREVGNIQASNNKKMEYWTLEEFKEFLKVVDDFRDKTLYMFLFYSGARIGELTALTWKDIDFDSNTIDINKTFYKDDIVTTPKTKSSIRKIKMPTHTMNMLKQLKLQQAPKNDYYAFGKFYSPYPFATIKGRFLNYKNSTNLKPIRLHDFRHSHASYLINNGYDIQIVSKRLGHAKISTTYDKYAHLYPNKEEEAIDHMNNDFKPADAIKLIK
ncbi:Site-specific recombinase XerD [Gracilibacillus orientalis]|uniref:Site-specific recombinase XerD n=1 Tax=Gracilibacillus orientalis TaxID=334253 RepID=A0A1I4HDW8_9BACI|nr:site-specific integrase [Gracilibacillus orientalis]SFL39701.1 Site-specific recombinase XerD [Gracilibacillus orientalis]